MSTAESPEVLDLVLVPRGGLTVVAVQDELVLYDPTGAGRLHRLDPRAALVWQLLDGTATVRQTAAEIAAAVGADPGLVTTDVAALVRDLRDLDLVVTAGSKPGRRRSTRTAGSGTADDDDTSEDDPAPKQSGGVLLMKRTPCFAALEDEGWHATEAFAAGPYIVGIRTSDESTQALVRTRFAPLLDPVAVADPNFSVRPAIPAASGRPAQLAQIFAGCTLVGRHRTTTAALEQLARELQATAATGDDERPWFLGSVVIVDGSAVLAPGWLWPAWTATARRLDGQPVRLLGRNVALDTTTGEAVLPPLPPGLRNDAGDHDVEGEAEQRFPISSWLVLGTPPAGHPSPAHALALAASSIVNAHALGLEQLLSDLAPLEERVEFLFAPSEPSAAMRLVSDTTTAASRPQLQQSTRLT